MTDDRDDRDDRDDADLRARLAETEERIDRIGKRLVAGYGADSDRDGWLSWLRQLTARRDALRAELGERADVGGRTRTTPDEGQDRG